jgi:hypothetical protein
MSESLGLSIGVSNLVAARSGGVPVARTPVLTLFEDRPTEVGLPEENPKLTEPGLVLRGFIERVGDPAPLVAADGTKYLGQALTIEALEAMARTVGYGSPITVAVPAYWSDNQVAALRHELFAQPDLAANGPPTLVSDATAALTALNARPGFPRDGVVALCDFGASGTSLTLADAGSNFQQIGSTVRFSEFSGDDVDQLILNHLLTTSPSADSSDVSATATSMGSVTRMLRGCRAAKEQLSAATVATVATGAAGGERQLSRNEFEQLISAPLDRFISAIGEVLQRNGIGQLAAVAAVGGGAAIPLIPSRLSDRLQVPAITTAQPLFGAAIGAATLGAVQSSAAAAATGLAPALDAPTGIAGAVGPATVAAPTAAVPTEAFPGNGGQTTDRALAWSEDSGTGEEPVPYTGPADYTTPVEPPPPAAAAPVAQQDPYPAAQDVPLWYRRPAILLSLAGAAAAILVAVVLALTLHPTNTKPITTTSQPPPITTTVIGPDNSPTETVITPAPVTVTTQPPSSTTTDQPTTTTSTTPTTSTTTTTTQPTTTTTQPTTTQPTTTNPPTTTQQPPPTTQKPPATTAAPAPPTTAAPAPPTAAAPAPPTAAAPAPPTPAAPGG